MSKIAKTETLARQPLPERLIDIASNFRHLRWLIDRETLVDPAFPEQDTKFRLAA